MKRTVVRSIVIFLLLVVSMIALHVMVNWASIAPELVRRIHGAG